MCYAIHASSAHAAMGPGAVAHVQGWIRWQGLPFVFSTAGWYAWAMLAPRILVPLVVAGGLAAAAGSSAPTQLRLGIPAYVIAFSVIGQPFNSYWGLVTAPLWAFGVAYSVEGVRWVLNVPTADCGPMRVGTELTARGAPPSAVDVVSSHQATDCPAGSSLSSRSATLVTETGWNG
jgi:hypothetical protein